MRSLAIHQLGTKKLLFFVTNLTMQLQLYTVFIFDSCCCCKCCLLICETLDPNSQPPPPRKREMGKGLILHTLLHVQGKALPQQGTLAARASCLNNRALPSIKYAEETAQAYLGLLCGCTGSLRLLSRCKLPTLNTLLPIVLKVEAPNMFQTCSQSVSIGSQ